MNPQILVYEYSNDKSPEDIIYELTGLSDNQLGDDLLNKINLRDLIDCLLSAATRHSEDIFEGDPGRFVHYYSFYATDENDFKIKAKKSLLEYLKTLSSEVFINILVSSEKSELTKIPENKSLSQTMSNATNSLSLIPDDIIINTKRKDLK